MVQRGMEIQMNKLRLHHTNPLLRLGYRIENKRKDDVLCASEVAIRDIRPHIASSSLILESTLLF